MNYYEKIAQIIKIIEHDKKYKFHQKIHGITIRQYIQRIDFLINNHKDNNFQEYSKFLIDIYIMHCEKTYLDTTTMYLKEYAKRFK